MGDGARGHTKPDAGAESDAAVVDSSRLASVHATGEGGRVEGRPEAANGSGSGRGRAGLLLIWRSIRPGLKGTAVVGMCVALAARP